MEQAARFLQSWRLEKKLSQMVLAEQCGVSQRHLSFIENGRAKPSRATLLALCRTLDMPRFETDRLLNAYGLDTTLPQGCSDRVTPEEAWISSIPAALHFPCVILDERWTVIYANPQFEEILRKYSKAGQVHATGVNLLDVFFSENLLCESIRNADAIGMSALSRAIREVKASTLRSDMTEVLNLLNAAFLKFPSNISETALPPVMQLALANESEAQAFTVVLSTLGTEFDWHKKILRMALFIPTA